MRGSTLVNDVKLPVETKVALNVILGPYNLDVDELLTPKLPTTSQMIGKEFFSVKEAEEYSSVSRYTLHRAVQAGELSVCKLSSSKNGKVLIPIKELARWINSKTQKTGANNDSK